MKAELARIPIWGWAARRYGIIVIDRESSGAGLRRMMREAQATLARGRSVAIFPEGTRVVPGERPPLRAGSAGPYPDLGGAVVQISMPSGRVWPETGAKHAGAGTSRCGVPTPPGPAAGRMRGWNEVVS